MPQFDNITIVVQGPLHEKTSDNVKHFKRIAHVVVSHWESDPIELIDAMDSEHQDIKRVTTKLPQDPTIWNNQNVYYQILSSHSGMYHVETDFVIKIRSDEYFGNLSPMITKMLHNQEKIITGNMHFRPDRLAKFHICDRIFGGKTEYIKNGLSIAKHRCEHEQLMLIGGIYEYHHTLVLPKGTYGKWSAGAPVYTEEREVPLVGTSRKLHNNHVGVYAETLIGTSLLMGMGITPNRNQSKDQVAGFFDIVQVEDMVPYRNKFGDNHIPHNWEEINKIEDL